MADGSKAGIPIFAMTANAFKEDVDRAMAAGINGFCTKPVDVDKLNQEIAKLI